MPGNTFSALKIDPSDYADKTFAELVQYFYELLRSQTDQRAEFYDSLRKSGSDWANRMRAVFTTLGAVGLLLTALAASVRFIPDFFSRFGLTGDSDRALLFLALVIYAIMGTLTFYEKGTDKTNAYFRHITVTLGIRDRWNKFQFDLLKQLDAVRDTSNTDEAQNAGRARVIALAEAYAGDLDQLASSEFTDWKAAFLNSLAKINEAATAGAEEITKTREEFARMAARPQIATEAMIRLTLAGAFDSEAEIQIDGQKVGTIAKEAPPDERTFKATLGERKIAATATNQGQTVKAEKDVKLTSTGKDLILTLS